MKKKSKNEIIDEIIKTTIRSIFATIGSKYSTEKEKRKYTDRRDLEWFREEFETRGENYEESKIKVVKERLGYDKEKYNRLVIKRLRKCLGVSCPTLCLYKNELKWIEDLIKQNKNKNIKVKAYCYNKKYACFIWKTWNLVID